MGYSPWGHRESDMNEQLSMHACMREVEETMGCGFAEGFVQTCGACGELEQAGPV